VELGPKNQLRELTFQGKTGGGGKRKPKSKIDGNNLESAWPAEHANLKKWKKDKRNRERRVKGERRKLYPPESKEAHRSSRVVSNEKHYRIPERS